MKEVWFYKINGESSLYGPFETRQVAEIAWQAKLNDPDHYVHYKWWRRENGEPEVQFIVKAGTSEAIVTLIQTQSLEEQARVRTGMGWNCYESISYGGP